MMSIVSILLMVLGIVYMQTNSQIVYATEIQENTVKNIAVQENVTVQSLEDVLEIIEKNNAILVKEEVEKQVIDVEYITKYQENAELPKGTMQVIQDGSDGKQTVIMKRTYENE